MGNNIDKALQKNKVSYENRFLVSVSDTLIINEGTKKYLVPSFIIKVSG
jgi:hypothetical protein